MKLNKTYDAVISLFHVISYQTKNEDLDAIFDRVYAHLSPGGIFIFDSWYGPAVLTERPLVKIKRVENGNIKIVSISEPVLDTERNCVDVNFTVFIENKQTGEIETFSETHVMRYLFVPEVQQLCKANGFKLIAYEEWLTKKLLTTSTWGACFICQK